MNEQKSQEVESVEQSEENDNEQNLVCPECGRRAGYVRKTKEPAYRCFNCHNEFSEEEAPEKSIPEREGDPRVVGDVEEEIEAEKEVSEPSTDSMDAEEEVETIEVTNGYSREEIETQVIKPLETAETFADDDQEQALRKARSLVEELLE